MNLGFQKKDDDFFAVKKDARREGLAKSMMAILNDAMARVIAGKKWNFSPAAEAAKAELIDLSDEVLLGHSNLEDFKAASRKWEVLMSTTVGASSTGAGNTLLECVRRRASAVDALVKDAQQRSAAAGMRRVK